MEDFYKILSKYPKNEIDVFVNYLDKLSKELKSNGQKANPWVSSYSVKQYCELFEKVKKEGLEIDGEIVRITQRGGGLKIDYGYQAFRRKLLITYPETIIDVQNVYEGDFIEFSKISGSVDYKHVLGDPFKNNKNLIGCYCVIKNRRGEFLEILNNEEIEKIKNTASTSKIWDAWKTEMSLKSILKRATKRHFYDIVEVIYKHDNEDYEPETSSLSLRIKTRIKEASSLEELYLIYEEEKNNVSDEAVFIEQLNKAKSKLNDLPL